MKKQLTAAILAALMTGVPYAASAQEAPPPGHGGGMLMRADNNHDGIITRDELLGDVAQRFAKMDANHDGKVTAEERDAARDAMMARRGGGADTGGRGMGARGDGNGDGAVTLDEQKAQAARRFDRIDANHDGKIDQAEQETMRNRMMAMRGARNDMPPPADAPKN